MLAHFVLLDRDGIINRMRPDYVKRWEEVEILPGAIEALARLHAGGCELIVVSNQSAIGRGLVSRQTVDEINQRLGELCREQGATIRAFLLCPHAPADGCDCRKPAPGLLLRARDELGIDLARAIMVGDQPSDVDAARAAGVRAILVDAAVSSPAPVEADGYVVTRSLSEAVDLILTAG